MDFGSDSRLLVVAAHPDDEVLGMGGTLAKAVKSGAKVTVLFLGEGISARFPVGQYDSIEFKEQTGRRTQGAKDAMRTLGIQDVVFGDRLCGQFDTIPILSIAKEIESVMDRVKPTLVFTHNPSEVNIDHQIAYKAVEIACRPARSWVPKAIYTFEIVCSGSWTFQTSFKPNVYVNVSEFWEQKMNAWHCYEGESRPFPFPRSDRGIETLARYRGMAVGLDRAESFRLERQII
jgi:LmbE family N-acetylglucosaminyl deacetylase